MSVSGLPEFGTYALILRLHRARRMQVGKLGTFNFPAGYYAYIGSAFGPGGIRARVKHHLAVPTKPHWHIDYFRKACKPVELWINDEWAKLEHSWARLMDQLPGAERPAPRFGSSDCNCPSHLYHFTGAPSLSSFAGLVRTCRPGSGAISRFRL